MDNNESSQPVDAPEVTRVKAELDRQRPPMAGLMDWADIAVAERIYPHPVLTALRNRGIEPGPDWTARWEERLQHEAWEAEREREGDTTPLPPVQPCAGEPRTPAWMVRPIGRSRRNDPYRALITIVLYAIAVFGAFMACQIIVNMSEQAAGKAVGAQ